MKLARPETTHFACGDKSRPLHPGRSGSSNEDFAVAALAADSVPNNERDQDFHLSRRSTKEVPPSSA